MITVIIPIYNSERYLHRCLSSVIAQTYRDLEIIVVDDGSTDTSLLISYEYASIDERVIVISKNNGGVSSARNEGLRNASGEYVMFLDSDDYMMPTMCEVMLSSMEVQGVDCVICGTQETGGGLWAPVANERYENINHFRQDFVRHLKSELLSPPWNKIYKRSLVKEYFDCTISFGEDLIFNLCYFAGCNKISFITDAPFYHEKDNRDSLVNKNYLSRLSEIEQVYSYIVNFAQDRSRKTHDKYIRDIIVYFRAIVLDSKIDNKEKYSFFTQWYNSSHLKRIKLYDISVPNRQKLLLLCIKTRMWAVVNIIINRKKFCSKN